VSFSVQDIKSNLQYGGARPSLFQVSFTNPATTAADAKVPFLCRAASLPASVLPVIEVPYFGRRTKVAGTSRQYENWTVTIYNDEDFLIRAALESWSSMINAYEGNIREFATASPLEYQSTAQVIQYGQTGNVLKTYIFQNIMPVNIGPIELDWENDSAIEVFTCEFALDYWSISGVADGQ
jgi:hypothetical protein